MKIIYRKNSFLFPPKGYTAINLFGILLFVRESAKPISEIILNHEYIHSKQWREMLFVFFIIWYAVEWLIRLIQYKDSTKAYSNISFEREAYANENNLEYLKSRKRYSWIKHLRK